MHAAARESLRELVNDRLGLLEQPDRELVKCASLLGYRLEAALLAACAGAGFDDTIEALGRACALNLMIAEPGSEHRYRFRHALTRAAVREALCNAEKQALHRMIACALERLPDAAERIEELAHHWSSAGDCLRAVAFERLAMERARRVGVGGLSRFE